KMTASGISLAPPAKKLLESGNQSWYRDEPSGRQFFDIASGSYKPIPVPAGVFSVGSKKKSHGVISENPGASVIDLGDNIACIEFHTKMNAIGTDILQLVTQTLRPGSNLVANFEAFVIAN